MTGDDAENQALERAAPRPLLFVHIPKTAGTSLRMAAEEKLGERVLRDYGPNASETSDFIRERRYAEPPIGEARLGQDLEASGCRILAGHVRYADYAGVFAPDRVVTFVREPIARVVSEYHHHRRNRGLEMSLLEFARRPTNRNRQARMLVGAPLASLACVGISERYGESLELLARRTGVRLPELRANRNPDREGALSPAYPLTKEERDELARLNEKDVELYAEALRLFDASLSGAAQAQPAAAASSGMTIEDALYARPARSRSFREVIAGAEADEAFWGRSGSRQGTRALPTVPAAEPVVPEVGDVVMTLGDAFLRHLEVPLKQLGYRVPMLELSVPTTEWPWRPNGIYSWNTPLALHETLRWVQEMRDRRALRCEIDHDACERFAYEIASGEIIDRLLLGLRPVSRQRFVERRRELFAALDAAAQAKTLVLCPAHAECWYDIEAGAYLDETPFALNQHLHDATRFRFVRLTAAECREHLEAAMELVRAWNPGVRFVLMVSPLPLHRTFSGEDVVAANFASKAILRAACAELADARDDTTYDPGLEAVVLSRSEEAWASAVHLRHRAMEESCARVCGVHFPATSDAHRAWRDAQVALPTDPGEALAYIEDAARELAGEEGVGLLKGRALRMLGRHEESKEVLDEVVERGATDPDVYTFRALANEALKDLESALADHHAADELRPGFRDRVLHLGRVLGRMERWDEAAGHLDAVLADAPKHHGANFWRAVVERGSGEPASAIERLEALCQRHPKDANARIELALSYEAIGAVDAAGEAFMELAKLPRFKVRAEAGLGRLSRADDPRPKTPEPTVPS